MREGGVCWCCWVSWAKPRTSSADSMLQLSCVCPEASLLASLLLIELWVLALVATRKCLLGSHISALIASTVYASARYALRSALGMEKPKEAAKVLPPNCAICAASSSVAGLKAEFRLGVGFGC